MCRHAGTICRSFDSSLVIASNLTLATPLCIFGTAIRVRAGRLRDRVSIPVRGKTFLSSALRIVFQSFGEPYTCHLQG